MIHPIGAASIDEGKVAGGPNAERSQSGAPAR
jgi:hypothetical protein